MGEGGRRWLGSDMIFLTVFKIEGIVALTIKRI